LGCEIRRRPVPAARIPRGGAVLKTSASVIGPRRRWPRESTYDIKPGQCVAIVARRALARARSKLPSRGFMATGPAASWSAVDVRHGIWQAAAQRRAGFFRELFFSTPSPPHRFRPPRSGRASNRRARPSGRGRRIHPRFAAWLTTRFIGEYGTNLSGGQRQRLAHRPAVLLEPAHPDLDDALGFDRPPARA